MSPQPVCKPINAWWAHSSKSAQRLGRDPATVRRSWGGGCACAPTEAEAKRLAGDRFSADNADDFGFVGTKILVTRFRANHSLYTLVMQVVCGFVNAQTQRWQALSA